MLPSAYLYDEGGAWKQCMHELACWPWYNAIGPVYRLPLCVLLMLQKDLADNLELWAVTPDIPATNPLTEKAGDFR